MERVPFSIAIADDKLLGKAWKELSLPQQVILKAFYGLPLTTAEELKVWSAQQGPQWALNDGVYDDLGFLTGAPVPVSYVPKEYETLTGVLGRRSGKSIILTGFIGAYEIGLGGHTRYVRPGVETKFVYIAQDMSLAQVNMQGIVQMMLSSPLLAQLIPDKPSVEQIKFKNGITLEAMSNTLKSTRGYAVCGAVFDELGFWYKDAKSANPDFEVERAIESAMDQFQGYAKSIRITTPWTKEGLAYEAMIAGTEGARLPRDADSEQKDMMDGHLVVYAPTGAMGNPLITRKRLARKRKRDPIGFARENLALFIDAQVGFLSHAKINEAVERGKVNAVPPHSEIAYVAVMDPAFRSDDYVLTIGHHDAKRGIIQDFVKGWTPEPGERLNPASILDEIGPILEKYHLSVVYSDQYQLESLQQLALDRNFTVFGFDLTKMSKPKVMQALNLKLNQGQIELQNCVDQTKQLQELQRTVLDGGGVRIAAPPGKHDDYATALALLVHLASLLPPVELTVAEANAHVNMRDKAVNLKEEATRLWEAAMASGDPHVLAAIERSDYLRAITEP
jgi:hypothetical protein